MNANQVNKEVNQPSSINHKTIKMTYFLVSTFLPLTYLVDVVVLLTPGLLVGTSVNPLELNVVNDVNPLDPI